MDVIEVVEGWLYSTLTDDSNVSSIVGTRVFDQPPKEGTEYPFIIYNGGSFQDIRGVGITRFVSGTIYTVKAVAQTSDASVLSTLAGYIDDALTLAGGIAVTGGTVLSSVRERSVNYREFSGGKHFVHRGGEYAILAQTS